MSAPPMKKKSEQILPNEAYIASNCLVDTLSGSINTAMPLFFFCVSIFRRSDHYFILVGVLFTPDDVIDSYKYDLYI
jgi:hypothetical protein